MPRILRQYIQNMNSAKTIEDFKYNDSLFTERYNKLTREGVDLVSVTDIYMKVIGKKRKLLAGR